MPFRAIWRQPTTGHCSTIGHRTCSSHSAPAPHAQNGRNATPAADRVSRTARAIATAARPRVFYAAKNTLNTEGAGSIVTDWIEMAGGVNVATENGIEGTFKDVSLEDLLAWDPDVIIARDAAHKTEYMTDSRFAELKAVKNNRVYVNPKGVFVWCVRSADEVLQPVWAATVIQPDLFSDVDMNKYTYDFYKKYYHYEASDADLQSILFPTE